MILANRHTKKGRQKPRPNDRNISSQHIAILLGATGCVRLTTLLQRIARCCELENGQIFNATFLDVACCNRLVRFVQQCCTWACTLVRFSTRNTLQNGGQTRTTCCAKQCCNMLRSNVAIVFPELANAGSAMLGYVALRCCYRLAGA